MKKLTLSTKNKKFLGVLSGLADYFDLDPSLVRVAFIFLTIFSGFFPGILVYFLSAAILPKANEL